MLKTMHQHNNFEIKITRQGFYVLESSKILVYDNDHGMADGNVNRIKFFLEEQWNINHTTFKVYQTFRGIRAIAINRFFNTNDGVNILKKLEADPMFTHFSEKRMAFCSRITPKPKRIMSGIDSSFNYYNFSESEKKDFMNRYLKISENFATCKFLFKIGNAEVSEGIKEYIDTHDSLTKSFLDLPLA